MTATSNSSSGLAQTDAGQPARELARPDLAATLDGWRMAGYTRFMSNYRLRSLITVAAVLSASYCWAASDADQRLLAAAHWGDASEVRKALSDGASVDAVDGDGNTALMKAAKQGRLEVLRVLGRVARRDGSLDARNSSSETALYQAANEGKTDAVGFLLDRGARVDQIDAFKTTALMRAAAAGRIGVARLLLEKGADRSKVGGDGKTAALLALKGGYGNLAILLSPPTRAPAPAGSNDTADSHYEVGRSLLEETKDPNAAIVELKKAVALDPKHGKAWHALSEAYFKKNDCAKTEEAWKGYLQTPATGPKSDFSKHADSMFRTSIDAVCYQ